MNRVEQLPTLSVQEDIRWKRYLLDTLFALVGALAITTIIYALHLYPRIPNISLIYLLVILALASTRGRYSAILSSLIAFLSFDFFLVPPLYMFTIGRLDEWLALFFFLTIAVIIGQLTATLRWQAQQAKRQAKEAQQREQETRILNELIRRVNSDENIHKQLEFVAHAIVNVFYSWGIRDCTILLPNTEGKLTVEASAHHQIDQIEISADEQATAALVMSQAQDMQLHEDLFVSPVQGRAALHKAVTVRSTLSPSPTRRYIRMLPLKTDEKAIGVVRLLIEDDPHLFDLEKKLRLEQDHSDTNIAFFWTFLYQAAFVIERARMRQDRMQVEVLRHTDTLRAALLSSVSHDLRTPLSSIKAAASSLLQKDVQWDEESKHSFAKAIEREADRLNRLVSNLLDMSRIEGGALKAEKEWYPIDELIHDVLGRMKPLLKGRTVETHIPGNVPPVELDYLQIDQVLTNLVENAIRYTPPQSPIEIGVQVQSQQQAGQLIISVMDRGPGIPPKDIERIFDKFYRVSGAPRNASSISGTGLGLSVCRGLVDAHGGRVGAENREGGGATFSVTLPITPPKGTTI